MRDHDSSPNNPQAQNSEDWLNAAADWWSMALSEAGKSFRARLDAQARRGVVETPEQVSPELFNEHVADDLLAVIKAYACFVRLGMVDYGEAMDGCLGYAWKRGAWGLNAVHLADLQDWLHSSLSLAIGQEF